MITLAQVTREPSECACPKCQGMCLSKPCWPTPEEAQSLIDAGYGGNLMVDYWVGERYDDPTADIDILCPASVGEERSVASFGGGPCSFLTPERLCTIHGTLKPLEGRLAKCDGAPTPSVHQAIAHAWNNPEAQALVERWRKEYGWYA